MSFRLLALPFVVCLMGADEPPTLDRQLLKEAPKVISFLNDKNCKNVAVLKFRVKKQGKTTDAAGPINLGVAKRLEIALVLASPKDKSKQIGIVRDASAVAESIKGASHLTKAGREALFTKKYPLAWGKEEVVPDVFLTGVVDLSDKMKEATVTILAFEKDGEKLTKVAQFKAATDSSFLVDSGESFVLRGAFDGGRTDREAKAVSAAATSREDSAKNPAQSKDAPLALEIRYDNKPVPIEMRDGEACVREPNEGQKVTFVIKRQDSKERLAAALFVNGENTLYKQRHSPLTCSKWVLDPEDKQLTLEGFKIGKDEGESFRVLSREESKKNEMNYGQDVGTVSLVVFREGKEEPVVIHKDPDKEAEEEDVMAIRGVDLPDKGAENLEGLRAQLRNGASTRGLIVGGDKIGMGSKKVKFQPDPTPVMALTVRYYRPQN